MADVKPFVGLPSTGFGCSYAPDLDQPGCESAPIVHILSEAPGWGPVSLASCADHIGIARAAGAVVEEHEYARPCDTNECWHG